MDTDVLRALLDQGAPDASHDAANWCNEQVADGPVPTVEVRSLLQVAGRWPRIVVTARGTDPDDPVTVAAVALHEVLTGYEVVEMHDPTFLAAITTGLDAAIAAGLIDATQRDAVLALRHNRCTRAAAVGLGRVRAVDVLKARAG